MLTFDDGTIGQFNNALTELDWYGYKVLFFVMTLSLNRKKFLSSNQVNYLAKHGHLIGCHTWDHSNVTAYKGWDWMKEVWESKSLLEQITGIPVQHFAYPFGIWNDDAILELKKQSFCAAYQLGGPINRNETNFTIRRMLVDGQWNIHTTTQFEDHILHP